MKSKVIFNISKNLLFFSLVLVSFSGRSLTGLYILNFRLGELIVGGLLILSLLLLVTKNNNFRNLHNSFKFLVITFFFSSLIINETTFSPYLIKSSSYIWMASLLFLSLVLSNFLNKNSWFYIYLLLPFVLFLLKQ